MSKLACLLPLFLCAAACDEERRPDQMPLAGWQGPPPRMALVVTGPAADEDKRERCAKQLARSGAIADPNTPVQAVLMLQDGANRLQVISRTRGVVRDERKPGWSMDRLCDDAIAAAAQAVRMELGPPPGYGVAAAGGAEPEAVAGGVYGGGAPAPTTPPAPAPVPAMTPPALLPLSPSAPKAVAELATRGAQAYQRGDYAGALGSFSAALHLSPEPALLFDTGVTHYLLGQPQQALQLLQLYVDRAPKAANRAQADALIAALHQKLGNDE
jgi:hypothetical protein